VKADPTYGPRERLAAIWAVAAVALVAALTSPGATGATGSARSEAFTNPYPPRVTMITDSVGGVLFWANSERDELAEGLDFHLETKTCRKLVSPGCAAYDEVPPSALETIQKLGTDLGRLVVIDVGYNDFAEGYDKGLDIIMGALAAVGVERVVWVTLHDRAGIDEQIRAAPARWPQLVVADWAPVAASDPSWFVDGAHMNELGSRAFVKFLRPVVLEACGDACVPPEALATMLAPTVRGHEATLRWRGNDAARVFDVAVKRPGGPWHTVARHLLTTSYRVRGVPGTRLQARVRALNAGNLAGRWSQPRRFRL
jgi:hypothetical protein